MPSLENVEFAENPEPRCPCVLLLDTSGSMTGTKIDQLREGLLFFEAALKNDALAALRVQLAVVAFNNAPQLVLDFTDANDFVCPPTLETTGQTRMAAAINFALDILQEQKATYRRNLIPYYRPWVVMITDGEPKGESVATLAAAAKRIEEEERNNHVLFHAFGVEGANMEGLAAVVRCRPPKQLQLFEFRQLFEWLSRSFSLVARSSAHVGTGQPEIDVPPPPGR